MSRAEGVHLVRRLLNAEYADEAEADEIVTALAGGLGCPHITDYVFWDHDPQPTPEKVVDRALSYEPFAL
ncbi:e9imm peptide [Streptomyces sp. NPDC101110]